MSNNADTRSRNLNASRNPQAIRNSNNSTPQPPQQRPPPSGQSPAPPPATNAWGKNDRSKSVTAQKPGSAAGTGDVKSQSAKPSAPPPTAQAFNAASTKDMMRKMYRDSIAGDTKKEAPWKPSGDAAPPRANNPWGAKANTMASGQDFWVQLMKQVAQREQGGGG
ncbi:MAG: hypothetical protein M1828_001952 [Chrysothrix sp. TS-e1954]|nr:MAG: hypothetical protein M1828_001952 [Chrysothrix sp. TS-e1954]